LTEAQVSAGGGAGTVNLTLQFKQGNTTVKQTWTNVPAAAGALRPVLRGDVASYPYQPAPGDPWALALSPAGVSGNMLFFASASASPTGTSISILPGSTANKVDVKLVFMDAGTPKTVTWKDLSANSGVLAKALLALPQFTAVFPVVSAGNSGAPVAVGQESN